VFFVLFVDDIFFSSLHISAPSVAKSFGCFPVVVSRGFAMLPPMSKTQRTVWLNATVFLTGAGIMTIELVASRLIARFLGSSLYTWTGVLGVIWRA
jgi:hypothetical protein